MGSLVSLLLLLTTAAVARPSPAAVILPGLVGKLGASSEAIDCVRTGDHLRIESDAHLDPACVWTGGVEIVASDVVFDCRGATIADPEGNDSRGIVVRAPTDVELSRIEVKNCVVRGFLNDFRVERIGFRDLAPGQEYDNGFSRVSFRNNRLFASRGSGIFVNAYVEGVTLRDLEISDSGGVGIYLEAGSRGTRVLDNHIHDNGYGDVDPVNGIPLVLDGIEFRYLSTGRGGIAIDGSRENEVRGNLIERNRFESDDRSHQAVLIGTRLRTERLGRPVADTVVRGNRAFLGRNPAPYVAIHPHLRTLFRGNRRDGALVGLADGEAPRTNFHLFVQEIWLAP